MKQHRVQTPRCYWFWVTLISVMICSCGPGLNILNSQGSKFISPTPTPTATPKPLKLLGSPHANSATVAANGIPTTANERDGINVAFVDNTPGKNANLVIFQTGGGTTTIHAFVSIDNGLTWTTYSLINNQSSTLSLGGVQDTVNHNFHLSWIDGGTDQYGRWTPTYTGGNITGFTGIASTFSLFDNPGDGPGARTMREVVDISGNHRLMLATSTATSTNLQVAFSTVASALLPASASDFCSINGVVNTDTIITTTTGDTVSNIMVAASSNLYSGAASPFLFLAGFVTSKSLSSWTITPISGNNFSIGAETSRTANFSNATLATASLSIFDAPSGTAYVSYGEGASSAMPGIHIASFRSGNWLTDAIPMPVTGSLATHAVVATDSSSNPAVIYADGSGHLFSTIYYNSAWTSLVLLATLAQPVAAWSISNVWSPLGHDAFGVYTDAGSAVPTSFTSVSWY